MRSLAVTKSKIADILQERGEFDEALRIQSKEVLPVFDRLGDVHSSLICKTNIAFLLLERHQSGDIDNALTLLREARNEADQLRIPELKTIDSTIAAIERPKS
jgi:hypothetical protein